MALNLLERTNFFVNEVFTPTTPAKVTFVEREIVNEKLVNALNTPGKQIVVYGHSGNGKSTLLINKLHQIYNGHITTRCMKGTTVNELIFNAFDKLDIYHPSERSNARKNTSSTSIETTYASIKAQLKIDVSTEISTKNSRILPPQLSPENLAAFMGERGVCWLIEDFHKVDVHEKAKLAQLMKVFMDCASDYPHVKIIATGAVETARQVVEYDPEMRNRVSEIEVNLMTEKEILSIIEKGEKSLNIRIPTNAKNVIAKYSSGLGAVCHQLCLNICNAIGLNSTSPSPLTVEAEQLERAITIYAEECSDTIRSNFEKARKLARKSSIQHADIIFNALCSFDDAGADRFTLLRKIQETTSYTDPVLKRQITSLTNPTKGGLIRFSENSGKYSFSNPIYRAYALTLFHKNGRPRDDGAFNPSEMKLSDLLRLLEKQLRSLDETKAQRVPKPA